MSTTTTRYIFDTPPTLEEAQREVGGYVELVMLEDRSQMLVNEEGLIYGLDINIEASILAKRRIVGNALVLSGRARWT